MNEDAAIICISCGMPLDQMGHSNNISNPDEKPTVDRYGNDTSRAGFIGIFLSVLLPFVGFILGLFYLHDKQTTAGKQLIYIGIAQITPFVLALLITHC